MDHALIREHALRPRNVGELAAPTHQAIARSDTCADMVKLALVVADDTIVDVSIKVYGCGYAIAGASLFSEAIRGKKCIDAIDAFDIMTRDLGAELREHANCLGLAQKAFCTIFPCFQGTPDAS